MDIGAALGCGAHLSGLRRTRIGPFEVAAALTLDQLEACPPGERDLLLAAPDALVAHCPALVLDEAEAAALLQGRTLHRSGAPEDGLVRAYGPGGFLGLAQWRAGVLVPRRLIATGGHGTAPQGEQVSA